MTDEERRILLVKASRIRDRFNTLSPEKRKSNEYVIEDYIKKLRKWESGSGLYPLPPVFLNPPIQPAAKIGATKEDAGTIVKNLEMVVSMLGPIVAFAEREKHVALVAILRSAIAEATAQRAKKKPARQNFQVQSPETSVE